MYMWHERNQCWKSDTACDTLPSPCTSRGESHSSGAAGGSASALCCEALLMDIGDRVDWEELGECLAWADGLSNGLSLIRCAENAPSLFDLFEHKNVPKQQQYQTWHTYDIPPLQRTIHQWQIMTGFGSGSCHKASSIIHRHSRSKEGEGASVPCPGAENGQWCS